MSQLIDAKLERVDKKHAALSTVNQQLMDALNTYHSLMKESLQMPYQSGPSQIPSQFPAPPQYQQYGQVPSHGHQQNGMPPQYPIGTCMPGAGAPVPPNNYVPASNYVPTTAGPNPHYPVASNTTPGYIPQVQGAQYGYQQPTSVDSNYSQPQNK